MEKELKQYKNKLRTQNIIYIIAALIIVTLMVMSLMEVILPAVSNTRWANAWNGFIMGVSVAMLGIIIIGFIINIIAMHDEVKLKKLYIREHDERAKAISERAGNLSYWFETFGLMLGIIVGGYFNITVAFVCLGCLFYICLIRLGLKLYYCKKI